MKGSSQTANRKTFLVSLILLGLMERKTKQTEGKLSLWRNQLLKSVFRIHLSKSVD